MSFPEYFSVFQKLSSEDQELLNQSAFFRTVKAGTLVYGGEEDCMGLLVLRSGQLRAHITSDEGKEITVYRLFERDICLFSASCVMNSIQFDIIITAEKDTEFWSVPACLFKNLVDESLAISN